MVRYTVSWPIQGVARFCSGQLELTLSDVYWRWIYDALAGVDGGLRDRLPFVEAVERGFNDPSNLVEVISVSPKFLEVVRNVNPSSAGSFSRVIPAENCVVPTAEQVLAAFTRIVAEATQTGTMSMQIE